MTSTDDKQGHDGQPEIMTSAKHKQDLDCQPGVTDLDEYNERHQQWKWSIRTNMAKTATDKNEQSNEIRLVFTTAEKRRCPFRKATDYCSHPKMTQYRRERLTSEDVANKQWPQRTGEWSISINGYEEARQRVHAILQQDQGECTRRTTSNDDWGGNGHSRGKIPNTDGVKWQVFSCLQRGVSV